MNSSIKNRFERFEAKMRFLEWLKFERFLESFTEAQLEEFVASGQWPDPLPAPLAPGKSRLDHLDRKSLLRLWREHERNFAGRTPDEFEFYINHGHWPEQTCGAFGCAKTREGVSNA